MNRSSTPRLHLAIAERIRIAGIAIDNVLDIGAGVGAIAQEMLTAGAQSASIVDASSAYLTAAQREAQSRGTRAKIDFRLGNFVDLSEGMEPHDLVTLDKVICCYDDMPPLVTKSVALARKAYGLVYPRDTWWVRAGLKLIDFLQRLRHHPFQVYAHRSSQVDALVRAAGFEPRSWRRTLFWQVVLYTRPGTS